MNLLYSGLHSLWRILPQQFRRRIFEKISRSGVSAVEPKHNHLLVEPITIAGYLTASTGLGQAARLAVLALEQQRYDVNIIDLTESLFHTSDVPFNRPTMKKGAGTVLMYVNPPVSGHALKLIGNHRLEHKHRIACWIWELPKAPEEWQAHTAFFHEICSSSRFSTGAIQAISPMPVRELMHPVAAEELIDHQALHEADQVFRVAAMMDLGSRAVRKNPEACVEAFALAFGADGLNCMDNVLLDMKFLRIDAEPVRYASLMRRIAELKLNVRMTLDQTSRESIQVWLASCDVLISLHTAEGFGLGCAEAMMYGVPCISTNWSATAEYIDESCGYPVQYTLIPAQDPTGLYDFPDQKWAKADIQSAATQLRTAYLDAEDRNRRSKNARIRIQERFSAERFCEMMFGNRN